MDGNSDTEQSDSFLTKLRELSTNGGAIGNKTLREGLGWTTEQYWEVRNKLLDTGIVYSGRGKGGSTGLVRTDGEDTAVTTIPGTAVAESDLYQPIINVLEGDWAKNEALETFVVEKTANQGGRQTGGVWSRPDLVVVSVKVYKFLPGKRIDVWTFEVKPALDIQGIYEASAHAAAATRSYLICPGPTDVSRDEELLTRAIDECKRLNIGLITFEQPDDFSSWTAHWDPTRSEPDPGKLNNLISQQFSNDSKDSIMNMIR